MVTAALGLSPWCPAVRPSGSKVVAKANRREVLIAAPLSGCVFPDESCAAPASIYDFTVQQYGNAVGMSQYKNENVNYPGLRRLYETYRDQGFNLVAFPCNQFGGQAPGTSEEQRQAAFSKFGFEFDVMDKLNVNGPDAHPLYQYLRSCQPQSVPRGTRAPAGSSSIEWNYVKFIVDRNGQPLKRYGPAYDPLNFEGDVRLLLAGKDPTPEECYMHPGRKVCNVDRILGV